jgi:intracellular sulfur oxidation DsrE/DsrF family protein
MAIDFSTFTASEYTTWWGAAIATLALVRSMIVAVRSGARVKVRANWNMFPAFTKGDRPMKSYLMNTLSLILGFTLLVSHSLAHAEKPADSAALEGVTAGKVVWDINMGDPKKLSLYLRVIQETYDDLVRQNVTPDMIFAFRGRSVLLISTDREAIPLEEHQYLDEVAELLADLSKRPGVRMEACSVACRLAGVETKDLLPGIHAVGNSFVSLIGYQAKGYGMIPIY